MATISEVELCFKSTVVYLCDLVITIPVVDFLLDSFYRAAELVKLRDLNARTLRNQITGHIIMKVILQFVCFLFFASVSLVFAGDSPTEDLKPSLVSLVAVLGDENLKGDEKKKERRAKIMDEIKKGFDFKEMSRRVLGKTWRTLDGSEKEKFTETMTKLLENVYVGKLEDYSGGDIEYVDEKIKKGTRAQVTTLIEQGGVKLPVHYIMRKTEEKWMVYDINIEGVSLVRNYQQQFKSILRKDKYEGLMKVLDGKNKAFAAGE